MSGAADILRQAAKRRPDVTAVELESGASFTYAQLDKRSSTWAQALAKRMRPGARVGVAVDNAEGDAYVTAFFAIQKAGLVFSPLNPREPCAAWIRQLDDCGAERVVCSPTWMDQARATGRDVIAIDDLDDVEMRSHDPHVPVTDRDVAQILYTSGTTGQTKGVPVTHGALATSASIRAMRHVFGGARFLHPIPLHTFAGMTFMLLCARVGMTNVLLERFDPHRFIDALQNKRISWTYAVSSMWLLVLKEVADLRKRELSHVKLVQFGASAMPPSAVLDLCDIFPGASVMSLYGLTEAGGAGCAMPLGEARNRPDSVGQPLPNTRIRIAEDGEIWLDNTETKQGWIKTGDVGYLDDDGFLYLIDRKKDLIIRGGHNIASVEVEDALYQHEGVSQAAVVAVPHPELGEDLVAFITLRNAEVTAEDLRMHLGSRLADYKVPRRFEVLEQLPTNAMGKVLKRELRERITR